MSATRAALAAAVLSACASAPAEPHVADDAGEATRPRLERFVPAGAEAIVAIDYARLRARGFARLFADLDEDTRARLRELRGFSDADDVDRAITVTFPSVAGGDPAVLELHEGRFSSAAVEAAFAKRHGPVAATRWRDRPVVAAGAHAMSLPEDGVLMLGGLAPVREAIDCRSRVGPCLAEQPWEQEVRGAVDERWGSRGAPALELRAQVGDDLRQRLARELGDGERLRWFGVRVGASRGLDALLVARAEDDREARDFAERLRGHLGELARRPLVAALGIGPALQAVRIGVRGQIVEAHLTLGEAGWARLERGLEDIAAAVRQARAANEAGSDAARPPAP